jgi:hypothetical protein
MNGICKIGSPHLLRMVDIGNKTPLSKKTHSRTLGQRRYLQLKKEQTLINEKRG